MSEQEVNHQPPKSKNFSPWILGIGLIALVYLFYVVNQQIDFRNKLETLRQATTTQFSQEEGDGNLQEELGQEAVTGYILIATEEGQTPFSLLLASEDVEYDQYDFGVFVTSINGQQSNSDYYWALYINEEYAQSASDQIELEKGDQVEWRWEEIQTEFED
jgi:hypothetical protein